MTHFLRKMAAAWIILGSVSVGFAQQQMPPIPTDPNVRIGKLDNGLTYYIRHNELPEKRADFYIAQKVGSILEEDNQRGLAHHLGKCDSPEPPFKKQPFPPQNRGYFHPPTPLLV